MGCSQSISFESSSLVEIKPNLPCASFCTYRTSVTRSLVQLVSGVADALALHLCRSFPESVLHRRASRQEARHV